MSLQAAHDLLGWPEPDQILSPPGSGPSVVAQLAKHKLQRALRRFPGCSRAKVGLLTPDPETKTSEAPLAVVVEFARPASPEALREAHRLAWNFARAPLLVTIDPMVIRSWSCCEPPSAEGQLFSTAEIPDTRLDIPLQSTPSSAAAHALSWLSLLSGEFFRERGRAQFFDRRNAADRLLLENLREVRRQLHAGDAGSGRAPLDYDTIHDLLARVMFMQFLADRRDEAGRAALNPEYLEQRRSDGTLSRSYTNFCEVLSSKADTYRLFRWLNEKFNGDLFPGEDERKAEERRVDSKHLRFLASFISGDIELRQGQRLLWKHYSFDVIPLDFISSIYEEFVRSGESEAPTGVVYTPGHLVEFILDGVLPWDDPNWNITILDPACGSGIFLVKAYQRLIHRWKVAHPRRRPSAKTLRRILQECLFGIDTEKGALRVASFSLYLAMCDEIDPKRYWTSVRFPPIRGENVRRQDFFEDGPTLLTSQGERRKFDLVVGNPPWGQEEEISEHARKWVEKESQRWPTDDRRVWPTSYVSIGPLFLPRAAQHTKPKGSVSLMQSSAVLLNDVGTARQFRSRLFTEFGVEEVVNLSALRYTLFSSASKATSPPCVITLRPTQEALPETLVYLCPKPARTVEDEYRLLIGPYDTHLIRPKEILGRRNILITLVWGGRRDLILLNRLQDLPTLHRWKEERQLNTREGIIRGDRGKEQPEIVGRKILENPEFPKNVFLLLEGNQLPTNDDSRTHSRDSTSFESFEVPQLLIKQSWLRKTRRFRAARVRAAGNRGVLCSQAYVTVHAQAESEPLLESACLVYNSVFALYWLYLNNHRLASFIAEATVADLLQVPLPTVQNSAIATIKPFDFRAVDELVRESLALHDTDWALIHDFFTYTLPDFKQLADAPGPRRTSRAERDEEELRRYCDFFLRVLGVSFDGERRFAATIFQETGADRLPVRLVAVHLDSLGSELVHLAPIASPKLAEVLQRLNGVLHSSPSAGKGIGYERIARVYDHYEYQARRIPTLFVVKPDQVRYWTASVAMRDADHAFGEIMLWSSHWGAEGEVGPEE